MIPEAVDMIKEDIADKTGANTTVTAVSDELYKPLVDESISLPLIQVIPSIVTSFTSPRFYEAHHADGSITQEAYDMDRIPAGITIALCVAGSDIHQTEDLAFSIRSIYGNDADTNTLMYPLDEEGSYANVHYVVSQVRSQIQEIKHCAITVISPEDTVKVPMPYPAADLRASLSDREALSRLLATYSYYMSILESDVLTKLANDYPRLFAQPEKAVTSILKEGKNSAKKGLFSSLRKTLPGVILDATGALDAHDAKSAANESLRVFVSDFQSGAMSKDAFEAYFAVVLPVVPDLYERVLRCEDPAVMMACAQSNLAEIQRRADAIADSLGIEENPGEDEYYKPRSLQAATAYVKAFESGAYGDEEFSMFDINKAYKEVTAQQRAAAETQQQQIADFVTDYALGKISNMFRK